ncbi:hypothetical protein F503_03979 [Ophiostoma piceae UAMH 11346]|uniref:Uncharacterized protein n=1 Tax=Ophiostoma piceae (strain UAMH 11346) TaxID=1262450 RepID=S3CPW3_OPHP1|nr:hypothetical protein F503_03979 [Ophiostoma piceae UAMH 11346]
MLSTEEVRKLNIECLQRTLARTKATAEENAKDPDPSKRLDYTKVIKNFEFLLGFYEAGGDPPAPGTTRWVVNEEFVEKPEPYNVMTHTPDYGLQFQLSMGTPSAAGP